MFLEIFWGFEDCGTRSLFSAIIDALPERFDQIWWILLSDCVMKLAQDRAIVLNEDQCRQLMLMRLLVFKLSNGKELTVRDESVTTTDNSDI